MDSGPTPAFRICCNASGFRRDTSLERGEAHTVLQAINRQLTHYAAHVGQIVLLAKHVAGPAWKTLSVPRGKSKEFEVSKRGARFEVPPGSGEPASRER